MESIACKNPLPIASSQVEVMSTPVGRNYKTTVELVRSPMAREVVPGRVLLGARHQDGHAICNRNPRQEFLWQCVQPRSRLVF